VIVFFLVARTDHIRAAGWLVFAPLFFYGWWNPRYVLLLVAPIEEGSGFAMRSVGISPRHFPPVAR